MNFDRFCIFSNTWLLLLFPSSRDGTQLYYTASEKERSIFIFIPIRTLIAKLTWSFPLLAWSNHGKFCPLFGNLLHKKWTELRGPLFRFFEIFDQILCFTQNYRVQWVFILRLKVLSHFPNTIYKIWYIVEEDSKQFKDWNIEIYPFVSFAERKSCLHILNAFVDVPQQKMGLRSGQKDIDIFRHWLNCSIVICLKCIFKGSIFKQ